MVTDGYRSNATRWIDRTLSEVWPRLEKKVSPELLPLLTKRTAKRVQIEEYGCGHYGCVAPTEMNGTVFKLTSDGTEAAFVANALKIGEWPEGIVRYSGLYKVSGETHRRRDVYVLWREEAYDVGGMPHADAATGGATARLATRRLMQFKTWAHDARKRLEQSSAPLKMIVEAKGLRSWAEDAVDYEKVDMARPGETLGVRPGSLSGARAVAWNIRACEIIADQMANEDVGYLIGRAFEFYMEKGILLADVHAQNVGRAPREGYQREQWVITDPGHMVPLAPARMDFTVEEL